MPPPLSPVEPSSKQPIPLLQLLPCWTGEAMGRLCGLSLMMRIPSLISPAPIYVAMRVQIGAPRLGILCKPSLSTPFGTVVSVRTSNDAYYTRQKLASLDVLTDTTVPKGVDK